MSKPELGVRIVYGRTFNLGDYNSKRIEIEISGDLKEVEQYASIDENLKTIAKQIGKTVRSLKKDDE